MTIKYSELYVLDEISFIARTDKVLTFTTINENGTSLNVESALLTWVLSPYGYEDYLILTKSGVLIDTDEFTITLEDADTWDLSGKFVQQIIITDFVGNIHKTQGIVYIFPVLLD